MDFDQMKLIDEIQLSFGREQVYRYLQYKGKESGRNSKIEDYIDSGIQEVKGLIRPRGGYVIKRKNSLLTGDDLIPDPVAEAGFIALAISTIGSSLEERADELMRTGEFLRGMIFDGLGSAAVSELSAKIAETIYKEANHDGLNTTRVFEPGAGSSHWGIENQRLIFRNIDASRLGVQLTPSYIMIPQKSISFIMGLGEDTEQAANLFSCEGCTRRDCPYRYIPGKEEGVETEPRDIGG